MVFWNLEYYAHSRRWKIGQKKCIIYRAKPHKEDKELEFEVHLIWSGKKWCAIIEGKYKNYEPFYKYFSKGLLI